MKITTFKNVNVNNDGTLDDEPGAIHVKGNITLSHPDGGCSGLNKCNCSPGHWIMCALPIDDEGTVRGMTLSFKSRKKLLKYLMVKL